MKQMKALAVAISAALLAACGGDSSSSDNNTVTAPKTYNFPSKVDANADSSVSYSGQVARNAMINELKVLMTNAQLASELGGELSVGDAVAKKLALVYEGGTTGGNGNTGDADLTNKNAYTLAAQVTTVGLSKGTPESVFEEADYGDISTGKKLIDKIAGKDNDLARGEFIGWNIITEADVAAENGKPNMLVQQWFAAIAGQAADQGHTLADYVSETGLDYSQLTQKFLLGAVAFSQASNDYLKDSEGLSKQNSTGVKKEGSTKPYTDLEHQWDEGFGYFGAARDYNNYSDADLKAQKDNDTNKDGIIDLDSEYTFAMAQYANKRDASAIGSDYSKAIMDNFLKGRQLIQNNFGTNPVPDQGYHAELAAIAKDIIMDWEEIFAANIIHYINATIEDLATYETTASDPNLTKLAKHWSELKGFALAIQFNPEATSKLSNQDLKDLNNFIGQQPVLPNQPMVAAVISEQTYTEKLESARDLLKTKFGFEGDVTQW